MTKNFLMRYTFILNTILLSIYIIMGCTPATEKQDPNSLIREYSQTVNYIKQSQMVRAFFAKFYSKSNPPIEFTVVETNLKPTSFGFKDAFHVDKIGLSKSIKSEKSFRDSLDLYLRLSERNYDRAAEYAELIRQIGEGWIASFYDVDERHLYCELFFISRNNFVTNNYSSFYFGTVLQFLFFLDANGDLVRVFEGKINYN